MGIAEKTLTSLDKNTLLVVAGLLLLNYLTKNKKMVGGSNDRFTKRLVSILENKYKQKGGMIMNNLTKIIAPMGNTKFMATVLLVVLNNLFDGKHKQKGGANLMYTLYQLLMPMGVDSFLVMLGLVGLTHSGFGKKHKGGYYGDNNCGCGSNSLEVVGDKALNYSKDLTQFGCKIPTWGSNLFVNGPDGQSKCI